MGARRRFFQLDAGADVRASADADADADARASADVDAGARASGCGPARLIDTSLF